MVPLVILFLYTQLLQQCQSLHFFSGLLSGIFILFKRLYYITLFGQFAIILGALLSVGYNIIAFLLVGLPILVLSLISLFLLSVSKKEFIN
jgi:hypothetical protein